MHVYKTLFPLRFFDICFRTVCCSVRIEKGFTRAVQPAQGHTTSVLLSAPEDTTANIIDTQLVYMTPLLDALLHVLSNSEFITLFTAQCIVSLGLKKVDERMAHEIRSCVLHTVRRQ